MTSTHITNVPDYLQRTVLPEEGAGLTDGQLLECFIEQGDETALAALVRRHSTLVWSICCRVLGNSADAEDAFQATFLVLVRRAASVRPREMVANWLYGVASQTARKARATTAKRRARERQTVQMPEAIVPESERGNDVDHLLHRALSGLPDKFRSSLILCYLEGKTHAEAARELGVPDGTLASWLARGRALMAKRLARLGLAMSAGCVATGLAQSMASASVPNPLASSTLQAVSLLATKKSVSGVISTHVVELIEGVMKEMLATKLKRATAIVLVVVAIVGLGTGGLTYRLPAAEREFTAEAIQPYESPLEQTASAAARDDSDEKKLIGSGKEGKKEIKVADFDALDIRLPIQVSVKQGKTYSVVITGDDNLLEVVKADKEGSTLRLSSARRSWSSSTSLKAAITLPALESVRLSGACRLTMEDFKSTKSFTAKISGASSLDGSIDGGDVKLEASGASKVKLKGTGKKANLSASGACHLHLGEFALDSADVKLSGACSATINAKTKLDYSLSGASHLRYQGNPTLGQEHSSGASSIRRGIK